MRTKFSRRQLFIGTGTLFGSVVLAPAVLGLPKPCWELPPNNPKWCPPPTRSTKGLLLLF